MRPASVQFVDLPLSALPAYTGQRAAQIVRLPVSTLRLWACGDGSHEALYMPASERPLVLSFENLVETFVFAAMRRVHNLSMQRVRKALAVVGSKLGFERPLLVARFRTDGVELFVEEADRILDLSREGQTILRGILDASLRRIDWESGLAARLYPWVRSGTDPDAPRSIVIDPTIGFGQPVLAGTGIEARIVAARYRAGESALALAQDYHLEVELIEDAIRCEIREAA